MPWKEVKVGEDFQCEPESTYQVRLSSGWRPFRFESDLGMLRWCQGPGSPTWGTALDHRFIEGLIAGGCPLQAWEEAEQPSEELPPEIQWDTFDGKAFLLIPQAQDGGPVSKINWLGTQYEIRKVG